MPAMSLICGEFIKSLLTPAESGAKINGTADGSLSNGTLNGNGHTGSDMEDNEDDLEGADYEVSTNVRKILLEQNSALEKVSSKEEKERTLDERLQRVAKIDVHLEF